MAPRAMSPPALLLLTFALSLNDAQVRKEYFGACDATNEETCKFIQCGWNAQWTAYIPYQLKYTNFGCCANKIYDMTNTVCQGEEPVKCYDDETFRCTSSKNCVPKWAVCNGDNDCSDGSDEVGCKTCGEDQFRCKSGECVAKTSVCNHQKECSDGSDETYCARDDYGWCGFRRFTCREKCMPLRHVCDGTPDCLNGLDEENCNIHCDPTNKTLNCFRGECYEGQLFSVPLQNATDRYTSWGCCNGVVFDMRNNFCSRDLMIVEKRDTRTSFRCNNGNWVDPRFDCDGVNHCSDGSDEFGCYVRRKDNMPSTNVVDAYRSACDSEQAFSCALIGPCFPPDVVCDGVKDCPGGEDEMNCLTANGGWCSPEWLRCPRDENSGVDAADVCLAKEKVCDGTVDCAQGFDEANCTAPWRREDGGGIYFSTTHLMYLLIGVAGFFSILVFCLFGVLWKNRKRKRPTNDGAALNSTHASVIMGGTETDLKRGFISLDSLRYIIDFRNNDGSMNTIQTSVSESLDNESQEKMSLLVDSKLIVKRDQIILGPTIGRGHFGNVNKGSLSLSGSGPPVVVAVKTLHRCNANAKGVNQFLTEALIMKDLKHPNVMQLSAMCLIGSDCPMVILPYMQNGNLLEFIRDENNSPNIGDMLKFALDIANGMSYLVGCRIIHRDLAARNCMLNSLFTVKVADFGLSRDVYEKEYYSKQDGRAKLPVRWMAIESIASGKYTYSSDAWSYGVLLWELMTRGNCPYPDVDNWDVVSYLKRGRRLAQPEFCPDDLYKIMLSCWHPTPESRPTFDELIALVSHLQTSLNPQENIPVSMDCDYKYVDLSNAYVNNPNAMGNYQALLSTYRDSQLRERDSQEDYYLQPVTIDLMSSGVEADSMGNDRSSTTTDRNSVPIDLAPHVPFLEDDLDSHASNTPVPRATHDRPSCREPISVPPKPPLPPKPKLKRIAQSQGRLSNISAAYVGSQYLLPKESCGPENSNHSSSLPNLLHGDARLDSHQTPIYDSADGERPYCEFDPRNC